MPALLIEGRYFFLHEKHSLSFKLPTSHPTTTYPPLGALLCVRQPFICSRTFFLFRSVTLHFIFKGCARCILAHIYWAGACGRCGFGIFFYFAPLRYAFFFRFTSCVYCTRPILPIGRGSRQLHTRVGQWLRPCEIPPTLRPPAIAPAIAI